MMSEQAELEAQAIQCLEWLYAKYPDIPRTGFYTNYRVRTDKNGLVHPGHFFVSIINGVINAKDACPLCYRNFPHIEVSLEELPPMGMIGRFPRPTVRERVLEEFHHHRNSILRARALNDKGEDGESFIDTASQSLAGHDADEEEIRTDRLVKQDLAEYEEYLRSRR